MQKTTITITTPRGLVKCLAGEVRALGYQVIWEGSSGVKTTGTFFDAMRLNLYLRTGHRVLYLLRRFECRNADDLYREVSLIAWEEIIAADGYLSVVSNVANETINDSRFANLRCKDAIVDRIQKHKGRRPDSGPEQSGTVINCYWNQNSCEVYIDTSGEPLSKRGYRKIPLEAPMQETLAAGIIAAAGWNGNGSFINPMCGSGTIAIEAAFIATKRPPALVRPSFGFMHTLLFDAAAWAQIRTEASASAIKPTGKIIATDIRPEAVSAAQKNARTAGVETLIEFAVGDILESEVPSGSGIVMVNPEYGFRLGEDKDLVSTYRAIGKFFKTKCKGYKGAVFTGNSALAGQIGLKAKKRTPFLSGKLECRLYEYDLY
jgi:putative N6-adenine-specific DNA methylase